MLNEKQFKVNPFYGKHYQVSSTSRHCSSNTSTIGNLLPNDLQLNETTTINSNVFIDAHPLPSKINSIARRRHLSLNKEEMKCWCKNDSYLSRASLSNSVHLSPININMLSSLSSSSSSSSSSKTQITKSIIASTSEPITEAAVTTIATSTNTSSSISSIQASTISTLTTINSNEQQINDLSTQDKTGILKIINKNYFFFTV